MGDLVKSLGFVNTREFQPAARHFNKYGRYDDGEVDTAYFYDYWLEEKRRCLEGYTTGGIWIPGTYYFYLNYCRIQIVEEVGKNTYGQVHDTKPKKARRVGKRTEDFPSFWDVDYAYYMSVDIAANGIEEEEYNNLPMDLHILPDWRSGGHHFIWLKPRGVGASWKGAAQPLRNFSLVKKSKGYMLANEKEFLTKDGIWSKFHDLNNWLLAINDVTGVQNAMGIGKLSEWVANNTDMHYEASVKLDGKKAGLQSEIFGVSLQNNWQKARGKRGQFVLWEELGKFPNAHLAWEVARESVEEGDTVFGTMIGFGTGGTEGANFESLKAMFYDPEQYNILCFDNIYDEGYKGSACGFFTPAYRKTAFIDKDGNSMEDLARAHYERERELAKKSKDPTLLPRKKAENPFTPKEAILETGHNIFISDILVKHRDRVENLGLYESLATKGILEGGTEQSKGKPIFKVKESIVPIHKYPHKDKYDDYSGAVLIFHNPYKKNGVIPKNLYKLCLDTYRHDSTTGDSVGAAYVIEQPNNFTPTRGDIVVASYVGRPNTQEEFNEMVFRLAEYYDAEIAFENDEPGDVVGYAKRKKKLHMLAEEFQLAFDEQIKTSEGSKRQFGMHMGSGKENKRKGQGDLFIKQWLYTVRYIKEDGTEFLNLHTIFDLGLLNELCSYASDKNADRVSAIRIGMYHQQELLYNEITPRDVREVNSKTKFFEKELF